MFSKRELSDCLYTEDVEYLPQELREKLRILISTNFSYILGYHKDLDTVSKTIIDHILSLEKTKNTNNLILDSCDQMFEYSKYSECPIKNVYSEFTTTSDFFKLFYFLSDYQRRYRLVAECLYKYFYMIQPFIKEKGLLKLRNIQEFPISQQRVHYESFLNQVGLFFDDFSIKDSEQQQDVDLLLVNPKTVDTLVEKLKQNKKWKLVLHAVNENIEPYISDDYLDRLDYMFRTLEPFEKRIVCTYSETKMSNNYTKFNYYKRLKLLDFEQKLKKLKQKGQKYSELF